MIKATMRSRSDDRLTRVVLGLSHGNLDRLRAGMPIAISGRDLGLDHDIMIFAGPTEEDMVRELHQAGMLEARTEHGVHDDEPDDAR